MPAILLSGTSGTGKTTLARAVALQLAIEFLPSSVGVVYAEAGTTYEAIKDDPERLLEIQCEIMHRHANEISSRLASGRMFVSDRGLDSVVYTAYLCRNAFASSKVRTVAAKLIRAVKVLSVLNVFVPTIRETRDAARSDPTGRRSAFLSERALYTLEGMTVFALEANNVPYITALEDAPEDRTKALVQEARKRGVYNA